MMIKHLKKIGLLLFGLAISAGILWFFYQNSERSRAAIEHSVGFFFSPATVSSETGKSISVDIQSTSSEPVSIATVVVKYPRTLLTFDKETTLNTTTAPCGQLELGIEARVIPGPDEYDTLILTRGTAKADSELPKNAYCFGKVFFNTKAVGTGKIIFSPVSTGAQGFDVAGPSGAYVAVLNSGVQEVAISITSPSSSSPDPVAPSATQAPSSGSTATPAPRSGSNPKNTRDITSTIFLRLQGITRQPRVTTPIVAQVKLLKEGDDSRNFETVSFASEGDGRYRGEHTFKNVDLTSKYTMQIKGAKHLQRNICSNSPSEPIGGYYKCTAPEISFSEGANTFDFGTIAILAGDLPVQNGVIDSADIIYVRNNVGSTTSNVLSRGDLNNDGIVDTQDFALIIYSLGFKYDEE